MGYDFSFFLCFTVFGLSSSRLLIGGFYIFIGFGRQHQHHRLEVSTFFSLDYNASTARKSPLQNISIKWTITLAQTWESNAISVSFVWSAVVAIYLATSVEHGVSISRHDGTGLNILRKGAAKWFFNPPFYYFYYVATRLAYLLLPLHRRVGLVTNEQMTRIGVSIDILMVAYCFFCFYYCCCLQTRDPAEMSKGEVAASVVTFKLVSLVFLSQRWHDRMNQWVLASVISTSHAITLCMFAIWCFRFFRSTAML
jgi:hypothetical protein